MRSHALVAVLVVGAGHHHQPTAQVSCRDHGRPPAGECANPKIRLNDAAIIIGEGRQ